MKIFQRLSRMATLFIFALNVATIGAMDLSHPHGRKDTCAMIEASNIGFRQIRSASQISKMIDAEAERIKDKHPYKTRAKRNIGENLCREFIENNGYYLSWGAFLKKAVACCQKIAGRKVESRRLFDMQHNKSNNGVDHLFIPVKKGTAEPEPHRLGLFTEAKYRSTGVYEPGEPAAGCQGSSSWIATALKNKADDYDGITEKSETWITSAYLEAGKTRSRTKIKKLREMIQHEKDVICCARNAAKKLRDLQRTCAGCTVISTATVVDIKGILKLLALKPKEGELVPGEAFGTTKNRFTRSLPPLFPTKEEALAGRRAPAVKPARRRSRSIGDIDDLAARLARAVRVSKQTGRRH